jgi:hypothetical protein
MIGVCEHTILKENKSELEAQKEKEKKDSLNSSMTRMNCFYSSPQVRKKSDNRRITCMDILLHALL